MTASTRVDEFEELRPHLLAVAYRLTGTVADAEDAVQDAWLRWDRTTESITDLRAWLTTVVSRLGLDRLRSAAKRRETYVGEWLPEPVVTGFDGDDPLAAVVAGARRPLQRDNEVHHIRAVIPRQILPARHRVRRRPVARRAPARSRRR